MISTHALQLFTVGVTLYTGIFHWELHRHLRASRWLVAWSVIAALYLLARAAQMSATDAAQALWFSRVFTALAPALAWTMLRFTLELCEAPPGRVARRTMGLTVLALTALTLATPWFVTSELGPRRGFFGEHFLGARGGPGFVVSGALGAGALVWGVVALARTRAVPLRDRLVFGACLALYGLLGASSVASALGLNPLPGVAEFGPLVVSIGTSQLVANRERQLARNLNSLVDQHTAALRVSEDRYRRLVDHAPIGVLACDGEGNVVAMTQRFREILEMRPRASAEPMNLLRDLPERHLDMLRHTLETGGVASGEIPYTSVSGKTVDLKVVIAPQRTASGARAGALILIEDVTERRAVEARLRQSMKLEAIGQLAAGIAQGINVPLSEVRDRLAEMRTRCDALRKQVAGGSEGDFADLEALIDESCEGVERALTIVRDMREISQGGSVAIAPLDLDELLRSVVRMAATRRPPGVEVVERYAAPAPIEGNAGQLQQVFLNLVVNALQAVRAPGRVEVESGAEGEGVRVRVRDDGTGIRAQDRERLFVPFFTTKAEGEGTGLGLFLSYQIVQRHRGQIRVDSTPGSGTTFEVWLPRTQPRSPVQATT